MGPVLFGDNTYTVEDLEAEYDDELAQHMSRQRFAVFLKSFTFYDKDSNNQIDKEELRVGGVIWTGHVLID